MAETVLMFVLLTVRLFGIQTDLVFAWKDGWAIIVLQAGDQNRKGIWTETFETFTFNQTNFKHFLCDYQKNKTLPDTQYRGWGWGFFWQ